MLWLAMYLSTALCGWSFPRVSPAIHLLTGEKNAGKEAFQEVMKSPKIEVSYLTLGVIP